MIRAMRIETPRLVLRRAQSSDLDALHEVLSDPVAMRWWSTPPHTDVAQTREWLGAMMASTPEESEDFVIEHEGHVVGKVGAFRLPEFGYLLHPRLWGQGLGVEAVTAFLDRVFVERGIPRLATDVDPENTASLRIMDKLGFRRTGEAKATMMIGGRWVDSVYFEQLRHEWLARRNVRT